MKIKNPRFKALLAANWSDFDKVVKYLEQFDIKPVIIGGLAVQHHGYPRFTEDIDILISRESYDYLEKTKKIRYGQLKFDPEIQVDVLTEGKDNNPDPESIRDGDTIYPTIEGLIWLKLIASRHKDIGDIAELIKSNNCDQALYEKITNYIPDDLKRKFDIVWKTTCEDRVEIEDIENIFSEM